MGAGTDARRSPLRRVALAWGVWLGSLGVLALLDHALRRGDGDIKTGGLPEPVGGVLLILAAAAAAWMLYRAMRHLAPWRWIVLLGLQAALGYVVWAAATLAYVCGTGIDCM